MTVTIGHDWDAAHQQDDGNKDDDAGNDKLTHVLQENSVKVGICPRKSTL